MTRDTSPSAESSRATLPLRFLNWKPWRSLTLCWTDPELTSPGLSRIRRLSRVDLDYIGQTSLRLRERLGDAESRLPAWDAVPRPTHGRPRALGEATARSEEYEASTCPVVGDVRWWKAQECVAVALYRQEHRRSPTFQPWQDARGLSDYGCERSPSSISLRVMPSV
jgi:hypothetical protein